MNFILNMGLILLIAFGKALNNLRISITIERGIYEISKFNLIESKKAMGVMG